MNMDFKDRKLLYWLDQDGRATNKELGRRIRLSEQGVGYKLRRLEEDGVIRHYVAFINTLALGYSHYKVLLRLQDTNPKREEELLAALVGNPNIRWVASCSGSWDVNFSLLARTPDGFVEAYRVIEQAFGDIIAEKSVHLNVRSPGFTRGYLLGEKSEKTHAYASKSASVLDDTDRRLLKAISQNARARLVDLAKRLGVSIDVVRYRLKGLERTGVISGYTLFLDLDQLGVERHSVYFSLHGMDASVERRMLEFARTHKNVIFMPVLVGAYDLSLELEVMSYFELDSTLRRFRELFAEHIKGFEIVRATKEHKYDFFPFTDT
jgi:DNA-binding Lrp family transcriptional regulator